MKKILGIGNALVDIITFLENDAVLKSYSLPLGSMQLIDAKTALSLEEATQSCKKHRASGGSAANTIHGLSRLGVVSGFIGTTGRDATGNFFREDMIRAGIRPHLTDSLSSTGRSQAMVTPGGERTMATFLGAAVELSPQQLNLSLFREYDHLHLEGYLVQNQALVEAALQMAQQCGMTVSLDLASFNVVEAHLSFLQRMVKEYVDIVFANEEEARAFTGHVNPQLALDAISVLCNTAVVKIGEKGSLVKEEGKTHTIASIPVKCIDTTGAGDLYASGFLYGFAGDRGPETSGKIGALLAGKVIEEPGAKIRDEVWTDIRNTIKNTLST
jgi:sugar/nucleoside kinase (ribokinase family)